MFKLFKILGKVWYFLLFTLVFIVIQVWFQLLLPEFMGNIQTIISCTETAYITNTIELSNPLTYQVTLIDSALEQGEMTNLILLNGGWMILCCLVIVTCALIQNYSAAKIGAFVGRELRQEMYQKVNTLSLSDYNKFGTSTLITRTTNDIEQLKNYITMFVRTIVMSPTYMIIALSKILALESPGNLLSLVLLIAIPLIIGLMITLFIFVIPLFKEMQVRIDNVTTVLRENLTGVRVIRAYVQQDTETYKFDGVNKKLQQITIKANRIMSVANPFVTIIFNFAFIGIYALGFYLLTMTQASSLSEFQVSVTQQITTISVVAQYSMQIMNSFLMFAMILIMIPQASASYKRVYEVLQTKSKIDDSQARNFAKEQYEYHLQRLEYKFKENFEKEHDGQTFSYSLLKEKFSKMSEQEKEKDPLYPAFVEYENIRKQRQGLLEALDDENSKEYTKILKKYFHLNEKHGELEFRNVTFIYPDSNTPTISNISFKTKPGKTTAIIGSTGSGKSTLVNLIPRFYDVNEGEILFDGINIKNLPQEFLRDKIGFVPQTAVLFSGTIRENIKFGKNDATDEEINEALRVAQAEHFVSKLPDKLDTFVSQGGKNYSGGQKQRLSIARCLVRQPEVYVFDDSFSALDFKTDAKLRYELKGFTKDASVIVVAQRVSSILDADNIIVLHEGKCVGQGTHSELLVSCPIYQDIVRSQLDPEEVDKTIKMAKLAQEGGDL